MCTSGVYQNFWDCELCVSNVCKELCPPKYILAFPCVGLWEYLSVTMPLGYRQVFVIYLMKKQAKEASVWLSKAPKLFSTTINFLGKHKLVALSWLQERQILSNFKKYRIPDFRNILRY